MSAQVFAAICVAVSVIMLSAATALTILRIAIGPGIADRLLGLAMLAMVVLGMIVAVAIRTGSAVHVDLIVVLALTILLFLVVNPLLVGRGSGADGDVRGGQP